jgi:hypothetical protein
LHRSPSLLNDPQASTAFHGDLCAMPYPVNYRNRSLRDPKILMSDNEITQEIV